MAGQGLNLGIADADALARAVLEGRLSGTDVGSKTLLGRYEEERKVRKEPRVKPSLLSCNRRSCNPVGNLLRIWHEGFCTKQLGLFFFCSESVFLPTCWAYFCRSCATDEVRCQRWTASKAASSCLHR